LTFTAVFGNCWCERDGLSQQETARTGLPKTGSCSAFLRGTRAEHGNMKRSSAACGKGRGLRTTPMGSHQRPQPAASSGSRPLKPPALPEDIYLNQPTRTLWAVRRPSEFRLRCGGFSCAERSTCGQIHHVATSHANPCRRARAATRRLAGAGQAPHRSPSAFTRRSAPSHTAPRYAPRMAPSPAAGCLRSFPAQGRGQAQRIHRKSRLRHAAQGYPTAKRIRRPRGPRWR